MPSEPPAVFEILAASRNHAADDVLLEGLEDLEPAYGLHAVRALLQRQRLGPLKSLVERYAGLPDAYQREIARHVHRLEAALPECIRSPNETVRLNAVDLIQRSGAYALSYLLALGLRSPSSFTRGHAAAALANLVMAFVQESSCGAMTCRAAPKARHYYARYTDLTANREHLLAALRDGLRSYDSHLRTSVLEAAAALSVYLEAELTAQVMEPRSKSWRVVQNWWRESPQASLSAFTLQALGHDALRPAAVRAISTCVDAGFMNGVLRESWLLCDDAIATGAAAIRSIQWFDRAPCPLLEMNVAQLRRALRLIRASSVSVEDEVRWLKTVLLSDQPDKQHVALTRIVAIDHESATAALHIVVDWSTPELARMALRELQRRTPPSSACQPEPNAAPASSEPGGSDSGGSTAWDDYWNTFDALDESQRLRLGRPLAARWAEGRGLLAEKLDSPDPAECVRAVQILRLLRLVGPFQEQIFKCLGHPSRIVRSVTVKALTQVQRGVAEPLLVRALEDPDRRVRANAVEAFDELRSADRVAKLTPKLQDPDHRIKAAAIGALLKLRVRDAAQSMIELLEDPSRAHRMSGLWLVEKLNLESVVHRVNQLAENDPDREVRLRARRLLRAYRRRQRFKQQALIPPPRTEPMQ